MLTVIGWVGFVIGAILIVIASLKIKRKSESELSKNIVSEPFFMVGTVITIISLIVIVIQSLT